MKSARKPWISGITISMRPELAAARDLSVDMCVFSLNAPGLGRMASAMDAYVWILLAVRGESNAGCPCRKSDPDVLVVETIEYRPRKNPADGMNYT